MIKMYLDKNCYTHPSSLNDTFGILSTFSSDYPYKFFHLLTDDVRENGLGLIIETTIKDENVKIREEELSC